MDDLVELVQERIMGNRSFTITELSRHFPLLVAQNCHEAPVVEKIMGQVGAKATHTRIQSKAHGVRSDKTRQEKVGSNVRLGRVRPDVQRPSQCYLCMEAVPRD